MDPERAEIAVQIVPEEEKGVAKRHVAMGTEYHHITRSVGEHLWTEDQETETEILTRETGADPVPELLEALLKADRVANAPPPVPPKPATKSRAVMHKPPIAHKATVTVKNVSNAACETDEKELKDKEVLALPEMKDSECHPKPPDVSDFGVSAVPENDVKCVSTSDLRIFKDAEMETTRKQFTTGSMVTDHKTHRNMWTSTKNTDQKQLVRLERNLTVLRKQ